ncbi:hypothetical protein BGZ54_004866 [Gamsiella multidivaricata]|nr:hypothetical protein BGZ54_004866 [Gamsiella multidivaricata]
MSTPVLPTSFQAPAAGDTAVVAPTAVLLPTYRYPSPPTFTGVRDGFACETWLTQVRRFFRGAQILDANRTVTAIAYLGEAGLLWWDGQYRSDDTDWLDFEKAFREEFRPAGFHDHIRALLFSIKMTSTVAEYVARVRKYMAILCTHDMHKEARSVLEDAVKAAFLEGAPLELKQTLMSLQITNRNALTIHDLCHAAEQFDTVFHYARSTSTSVRPTQAAQHALAATLASPAVDPMAMEIDNMRLEINALRKTVNKFRSGSYTRNKPPLDAAERTRCIRENRCFRCREVGHIAPNCPENERGGRAFNNFTEGPSHADGSGKASSGQV